MKLVIKSLLLLNFASAVLPQAAFATDDRPGSPLRFCRELEEVDIQERFRGCSARERDHPDVKAAVAAVPRATQQCLDLISSGMAEKRVKWDREAAARCLAAYRSFMNHPQANSSPLQAARLACAGAVQGLRNAGDGCNATLECRPGLACIGATGGPPGTCKAPLAQGTACDDAGLGNGAFFTLLDASRSACAAGLHCAVNAGALTCLPVKGAGAAGESCSTTAACQRGHVCHQGQCVRRC